MIFGSPALLSRMLPGLMSLWTRRRSRWSQERPSSTSAAMRATIPSGSGPARRTSVSSDPASMYSSATLMVLESGA